MKFNYFDNQAIKLAYGYIPKKMIKMSQYQITNIYIKQLQRKILDVSKKSEEDYLDFMTNLMKKK